MGELIDLTQSNKILESLLNKHFCNYDNPPVTQTRADDKSFCFDKKQTISCPSRVRHASVHLSINTVGGVSIDDRWACR